MIRRTSKQWLALFDQQKTSGLTQKISILELVLADTAVDTASASFDMQMLMGTRGRERTGSECLRRLLQCGLV